MRSFTAVLALAIVVLGCQQEIPQTSEAEVLNVESVQQIITERHAEWVSAELQKDAEWLQENLDERYIAIPSSGRTISKAEFIEEVVNPETTSTIEFSDFEMQVFDGFVSTQYVFDSKGQSATEEWDNHLLCMDLWVLGGDEWKLLRTQCTRIEG